MTALDLIIIVLIVIGGAIGGVLIAVAVSSLYEGHRLRLEPQLSDARMAIIAALSGEPSTTEVALARLSRFSERYIVGVLLDVAPWVEGTSRSVLITIGEQVGVLDKARSGVLSRRWGTRLYSARVLTAFGIAHEDMNLLFRDRAPEVRAQAAAWCVTTPTAEGIEHLIALLGDDDGQCRFAAQDALIRIGLPASLALLSALERRETALIGRVLIVAAAIGDERFFEPAQVLTIDTSSTTRGLAASVLASTGNPAAGPILVSLLNDPSEEVVLAASAGLARLSFWPGAAAVEELLGDQSWVQRKQAGMTLLAMGPPGTILLRADAVGVGPASAMAVQALQIQSLTTQESAA